MVKTTTDAYVGRVSLVRVFSGTVLPDATVHVSGHLSAFVGPQDGHEDHDEDERIGALSVPLGGGSGRSGGWSPATSARSAGSPAPRPGTPCPTRTPRWC